MRKLYVFLMLSILSINTYAQCWQKVNQGGGHTIALKTDGTLWSCGYGNYGALGIGGNVNQNSLTQIGTSADWAKFANNGDSTFAIKTDGTLWAWGRNHKAQLGDETYNDKYLPIQISAATNWQNIESNGWTTFAQKTDGSLWIWGDDNYGQVGNGPAFSAFPTQIGLAGEWLEFKGGGNTTLAIKSNGTLWAWGLNNKGQLGDGTLINKNVPIQIGTDSNWQNVYVGFESSFAIKTDGTLWSWGDNTYGQLGDGTNINKSVPTLINSATNWQKIIFSAGTTFGIKTDGTLWSWGNNNFGQLGDGTTVNKNIPIQIGTETNWQDINSNYATTALKNDGTLWAWGWNFYGQLGDGSNINKSIPTQIGSASNWYNFTTNGTSTSALKTNGELWSWGNNSNGSLGDGTFISKNEPAKINCPTIYIISGNTKFDSNNNGCDNLDITFPNLKFNITNAGLVETIIPNSTGNYSFSLQPGTHNLTPIIENPSFFSASPASLNIDFPTNASPFIQNFCILPNGNHNDLEVILIPLTRAVPGFDIKYELIYKNKGNIAQSGNINLSFPNDVLDYISATPAINGQSLNNLNWNFINLQPFETRKIKFILKANSPTETPPLNSGDNLNYIATISSTFIDENNSDNISNINQKVFNSFDPNQKTCLEGETISTEKIGDYVHYIIQFENLGTANATNVRLKDYIDLSKFDINTLTPISASHPFTTRITDANKVEFIFEDINLPFDDENNDGYVVFKIKTTSTLILGDSFSNNASIYFDFNFPIITNTATTLIEAQLTNSNFNTITNNFTIYPNPTNSFLNIKSSNNKPIDKLIISDLTGKIILQETESTDLINVQQFENGIYFIQITSEGKNSIQKFSKK